VKAEVKQKASGGVRAVRRALESKSRIIQLINTELDEEAVEVLAAGLASNRTVAKLILASNLKGVQALGTTLKTNTALRDINLTRSCVRCCPDSRPTAVCAQFG
jgi:hypothetical protein